MAPSTLMNWGDKVHTDVLTCITDVLKPSPAQWEDIIKHTQNMGYSFSLSALKYDLAIPNSFF